MDNNNMDGEGTGQSSYAADDLPDGGMAELEVEEIRKRLKEENKNGQRKYAEAKLGKDGAGFE